MVLRYATTKQSTAKPQLFAALALKEEAKIEQLTSLIVLLTFGLLLCCAALVFIKNGSKQKNKWGINNQSVNCPNCGNKLPQIRKPQNIRQALWGGYTCEKCKTEVDKWGKKISES